MTMQTTETTAPAGSTTNPSVHEIRLLRGLRSDGRPVTLADHRADMQPPSSSRGHRQALLNEIEASGLRGRGGAGFSTAVKLAAIAGRNPVIVVNATEGEPVSEKDRLLVVRHPHLVLDGAILAAHATGSSEVRFCVGRGSAGAFAAVREALAERGSEPGVSITVHTAPHRFVAGEESALVHWLNGGDAVPTGHRVRPFVRGVSGRPTSVNNAETLAHLAQIVTFGAPWFRGVGTADEPGTRLTTVMGPDGARRIVEAPVGAPLAGIAAAAGADVETASAVLVGGYFGTWLTPSVAQSAPFSERGLAPSNASTGCGVIVPLPASVCPWCETARILQWMAGESAGQCGVCVNGLPAMAGAAAQVGRGIRVAKNLKLLQRWAGQVDGRGGCRLPDGAVHLLRSALDLDATLLNSHAASRGCPYGAPAFLPMSDTVGEPWR